MKRVIASVFGAAIALAPAAVLAHPGHGDQSGLLHGFVHPLTGIDHVLAMVAVGLLAVQLGGRALWLVPMSFVVVMAFGGVIGMAGLHMPMAEMAIAISVIVLGLAVAFQVNVPVLTAMSVVGFFALFHGYAHGAEMPTLVSGLSYAAGFIAATGLLHGLGVGLGLLLGLQSETFGGRVIQAGGGVIALSGVAVLTNFF